MHLVCVVLVDKNANLIKNKKNGAFMSDKDSYRVVGDRIITEKQYQSEKDFESNWEIASKFGLLTIPAGIAAGIWVFIEMFKGVGGVGGFLIGAFFGFGAGLLVYTYFITGLVALLLITVLFYFAK